MIKFSKGLILSATVFFCSLGCLGQPGEKRIQYPKSLKNAFFGINMGYLHYPYSSAQLEPGFTVESIKASGIGPRIILYGYQINNWLSAQMSYMRPVNWVVYQNINGDKTNHNVWMNYGTITLASRLPLAKRFSLNTEAGLAIVTRKGFEINDISVVKNENFATILAGGSLQYHLNKKWDLQLTTAWSPSDKKRKQPQTMFYSAGFNYNLKELPQHKVDRVIKSGYHFPSKLLQASFTSNVFGYGTNDLFSQKIPIFWGGSVHVKKGFSVNYQQNIFHARKVFSLDWGLGMGFWKTELAGEDFFTLSAYPVARFNAIRSPGADFYFEYTAAGPTYISKHILDNAKLGKKFTFYDAMGIGMIAGKRKNINAGIRIAHFSNGNIFPHNTGVKVPLSFSFGYCFP